MPFLSRQSHIVRLAGTLVKLNNQKSWPVGKARSRLRLCCDLTSWMLDTKVKFHLRLSFKLYYRCAYEQIPLWRRHGQRRYSKRGTNSWPRHNLWPSVIARKSPSWPPKSKTTFSKLFLYSSVVTFGLMLCHFDISWIKVTVRQDLIVYLAHNNNPTTIPSAVVSWALCCWSHLETTL